MKYVIIKALLIVSKYIDCPFQFFVPRNNIDLISIVNGRFSVIYCYICYLNVYIIKKSFEVKPIEVKIPKHVRKYSDVFLIN